MPLLHRLPNMTSRTVRIAEIPEALAWIATHRDHALAVFKQCNPS